MKVKRFDNLWAMGLILCGVLLVTFYILKIFFPEFIIGVAETPRVVKFGRIIQSNKIYLHAFNFVIGYIYGYIHYCACCRTYKLNIKSNLILVGVLILLRLISEFYPTQYLSLNCASIVITPFLMCYANKNLSKETFCSTLFCFIIELGFEFFSLAVRDLTVMTSNPNVVSFIILLIDSFIWRIMLYLFYNYKTIKKEDK